MSHFRSRVITRDMFWAPESPAMPGIAGDSGALCVALGSGCRASFFSRFCPPASEPGAQGDDLESILDECRKEFLK
jgi:hypothetical protein